MKAFNPAFQFVYGDAEFTPDLHTPGGLVSLALHSERGSLYRVNADADRDAFCANTFRQEHIWTKLPLREDGSLDPDHPDVVSYEDLAGAVDAYFRELTGGREYRSQVGLVADHGTQDMQRLHNLFGNDWFGTMPAWVPKRPFLDIATLEDIAGVVDGVMPNGEAVPGNPPQQAHHAMADAHHDRIVHEFLLHRSAAVRVASGVEQHEDLQEELKEAQEALDRVRQLTDAIDTEMRAEPDTQRAATQMEAVTRLRGALAGHGAFPRKEVSR